MVNVHVIEKQHTIRKVVKPSEQLDQRAFTRTRGSNNGQLLAGLYHEGHVLQDRITNFIIETDPPKLDLSPDSWWQRDGRGRFMNLFVPVQGLKYSFPTGHRTKQYIELLT